MFFTKTILYLLFISLAFIASLVFIILAIVKPKKKRFVSRKLSLAIGIVLLAVAGYSGIDFTGKAYTKIKKTVTALKNFPEIVGTDQNKDTSDYVKALKLYEPEKYKGK